MSSDNAHFYLETENNDVTKNRIAEISLKGTVVSVAEGLARVRLDGRLKIKHSFYHKDDGKFVEATLVGFLDADFRGIEPGKQSVKSFRLVTEKATYGQGTFAVAVRSVP